MISDTYIVHTQVPESYPLNASDLEDLITICFFTGFPYGWVVKMLFKLHISRLVHEGIAPIT
jgi:hypothetical protein